MVDEDLRKFLFFLLGLGELRLLLSTGEDILSDLRVRLQPVELFLSLLL